MLVISSLTANPAVAQEWLNGSWVIVESWGENDQAGEWRYESPQPSLFIFLDGYYSIAYVNSDSPRPLMDEDDTRIGLTPEEAAAVWLTYVSNSGTYEIDGSAIVTRPTVALWPNFMEGGSATYVFEIEGDMLRLTRSENGFIWNARLRRAQ
jgi:hypothetical protein